MLKTKMGQITKVSTDDSGKLFFSCRVNDAIHYATFDKLHLGKVSFFVQCIKKQLITLQNVHIKLILANFFGF